jgi:hypothetical protein
MKAAKAKKAAGMPRASQEPAARGKAPSVREVVRRLEMISHFQRGGTEG